MKSSPDSECAIRASRAEDLEAVRALIRAALLPEQGLSELVGEPLSVAEREGWIVGAAGVEVHGCEGLLRSVVVAENWRRRDLGSRLVEDRLAWARSIGLDEVYLLTLAAEPFFFRLGFRRVARDLAPSGIQASPEFASLCPDTAVLMRRAP